MVVNNNITGPGGIPPANSSNRPGSKIKAGKALDGSPGVAAPTRLDSPDDPALIQTDSNISDTNAARAFTQSTRAGLFQMPATALLAQANLSPDTVLSLLEG